MKKKTKVLSAVGLGLVVALGVGLHASGNLEQLQGRFGKGGLPIAISISGSTPKEDIIIAGSYYVPVATYDVTGTKEDFVITDLTIENKGKLGGNDNNIVDVKLSYEDINGNTVSSKGYLVNAVATFSGLSLYVPKDSTVQLEVYVDLNKIQSAGSTATAGEKIQLYVGTSGFKALGQTTGKTISNFEARGVKQSNFMHVYETKPTLALAASSPSGSRAVSTSDDAFIFNVTADAAGRVKVKELTVNMISDGDFDTTAAVTANLNKPGGVTLASAPVKFTDASNATATFKLLGNGEVGSGMTDTWVVNLDTSALLDEESGIDDPLVFEIDYGSSTRGVVTNGGLIWYDDNVNVKWLGNTSVPTLLSNTVNY